MYASLYTSQRAVDAVESQTKRSLLNLCQPGTLFGRFDCVKNLVIKLSCALAHKGTSAALCLFVRDCRKWTWSYYCCFYKGFLRSQAWIVCICAVNIVCVFGSCRVACCFRYHVLWFFTSCKQNIASFGISSAVNLCSRVNVSRLDRHY